jgi:hypothetical protein
MPIFDHSVLLPAPRAAVMHTIKNSFTPQDTLIVLREAPIIIGLGREVGYVYAVASDSADTTQLRLIVDRASHVRDAFRMGSPRTALEALSRTSRGSDPRLRETAQTAFEMLQQQLVNAESTPPPSKPTTSLPLARLFSRPKLRL